MSVIVQVGVKGCQLYKFGGSSLVDVKCYLCVVGIMKEYLQVGDMMVVFVVGSIINQLISWFKFSQSDCFVVYQVQQLFCCYYIELIGGLLEFVVVDMLIVVFIYDFECLVGLLDGGVFEVVYVEVVGYGEVWFVCLMVVVFNQLGMEVVWLDVCVFLCVECVVQLQVDEGLFYLLLQQLMVQYFNKCLVVIGFIFCNQVGEIVLLGCNGFDYFVIQIGVLVGVFWVIIWSDVVGVYSVDLCKVKDVCLLLLLCLDEVSELVCLVVLVFYVCMLQLVFVSDIDLQLCCSYMLEQGFMCIECVLVFGIGVWIVISYDDVCLVEFQVLVGYDFKLVYKELDVLFKCVQLCLLVVGVYVDCKLLQFCYIFEVVDSVLKLFDEVGLLGELCLCQKLVLVVMVGVGVICNLLYCYCFWQQFKGQLVEFIWQFEEGISLVVVLCVGLMESLIQGLYQFLFCVEKCIGLMLFGKGNIGFCWLEFFVCE